jgi:hypothetical protein
MSMLTCLSQTLKQLEYLHNTGFEVFPVEATGMLLARVLAYFSH